MREPEALIVGAGLSGLACAFRLQECGKSFQIVEASDDVGGRVRTDVVDGFRLDRGFQVLLTATPEAERCLDYHSLDLKRVFHGALIRSQGAFHRIANSRHHPWTALKSLGNPIGSLRDRFRLLSLIAKVRKGKVDEQFARPEGLTLDFLRWGGGFSESMIDRFFRPLFGSVFLERDLVTSSRIFRFMLRMMVEGDAAVPAAGMSAIPRQLAGRLPPGTIRFGCPIEQLEPGRLKLRSGEHLRARAIVVATEGAEAARLLQERVRDPGSRDVTCIYFAAAESPIREPIVTLNADEPGPVNHLAVMSDVAPSYAPPGHALISVSVLGNPEMDDAQLESEVRRQLIGWFGSAVDEWRHLRTYRIRHALPDMTAPALDEPQRPVQLGDGLFVCGDHREHGTIHGALASGWRAAQAVAAELEKT